MDFLTNLELLTRMVFQSNAHESKVVMVGIQKEGTPDYREVLYQDLDPFDHNQLRCYFASSYRPAVKI